MVDIICGKVYANTYLQVLHVWNMNALNSCMQNHIYTAHMQHFIVEV